MGMCVYGCVFVFVCMSVCKKAWGMAQLQHRPDPNLDVVVTQVCVSVCVFELVCVRAYVCVCGWVCVRMCVLWSGQVCV